MAMTVVKVQELMTMTVNELLEMRKEEWVEVGKLERVAGVAMRCEC